MPQFSLKRMFVNTAFIASGVAIMVSIKGTHSEIRGLMALFYWYLAGAVIGFGVLSFIDWPLTGILLGALLAAVFH